MRELPCVASNGGDRIPPYGSTTTRGSAGGLGHDVVGQDADALDLDLDPVAGLQRAHAGRGAGQEHVAGQQGHHPGDEGQQVGHAALQLGGAGLLLHLAVDQGGDGQVAGVEVGLDPGAEGAEGVEALGPRPLAVGALQVARGHVVGAGEAEHGLDGVGRLEPADQLADDHGQLALEVDLAHPFGADDGVAGADHRGRGLEEDHRLGRDLVAQLAGVLGVVAADGDHLAGQHRREQPDLGGAEPLAGVLEGAEGVGADRGYGVAFEDAEADVALAAVADDAHAGSSQARRRRASRARPVPKARATIHWPASTSPAASSCSRMNRTVAEERLPPSASTSRERATWASPRPRRRWTRSTISGPPGWTAQWATSAEARPWGRRRSSTSRPTPRSTRAGTRGESHMWKPSSSTSQPIRSSLRGTVTVAEPAMAGPGPPAPTRAAAAPSPNRAW